MSKTYNILILCTGNSARSILCEMLVNRLSKGRFHGYSAGSTPTGKVNPLAVRLLKEKGYPIDGLRSKSWEEFAESGAPKIDLVITVCDDAAGEVCPIWPGNPTKTHWGVPDPAAIEGSEEVKMQAFDEAYEQLERRISALVTLPLDKLKGPSLKRELDDIGRT